MLLPSLGPYLANTFPTYKHTNKESLCNYSIWKRVEEKGTGGGEGAFYIPNDFINGCPAREEVVGRCLADIVKIHRDKLPVLPVLPGMDGWM